MLYNRTRTVLRRTFSTNPLLSHKSLPRFSAIIPSTHITPAVTTHLAEYKQAFQKVEASLPSKTTATSIYNAAINELEQAAAPLSYSWGITNHLMGVQNSTELRQSHEELQPLVVAEIQTQSQSQIVFKALQTCRQASDYSMLDSAQQRILNSSLQSMEHSGVGLPNDARTEFNAIQQELATLSTTVNNNVLDSTKSFRITFTNREDVKGLPDTALVLASSMYKHESTAEDVHGTEKIVSTPENGPWTLTLDMPLLLPCLQHLEDRAVRKQLYTGSRTVASTPPHDNTAHVARILQLRQRTAEMLEFENYAELSLSSKMAPNTKAVSDLSEMLRDRCKPAARNELLELQQFATTKYQHVGELELWDVAYYSEKLREELYSFTDEDVLPYFPLHQVQEGLFQLATTLFGIRIEEQNEVDGWHQDVQFFHVYDGTSNAHISSFYLDPYSRPGEKRGGAWMDQLFGKSVALHQKIPVAYLVCNGSPPTEKAPSLMTFRDVETLFHEFGHGLQHMLTEVEHGGAAGINNVEWDAVELPSQFMENFCYHEKTLMGFAKHYKTGEVLPADLFDKIKRSRNFQAGMAMSRQLFLGQMDMELHTRKSCVPKEVQNELAKEYLVMPLLIEDRQLNSFLHIFAGGYSAGYFSYKWAEVLSADAFGMFEEEGLEDDAVVEKLGRQFRRTVLAQGGSKHPMEVFVDFRGREPDHEALLRHSGLVEC